MKFPDWIRWWVKTGRALVKPMGSVPKHLVRVVGKDSAELNFDPTLIAHLQAETLAACQPMLETDTTIS